MSCFNEHAVPSTALGSRNETAPASTLSPNSLLGPLPPWDPLLCKSQGKLEALCSNQATCPPLGHVGEAKGPIIKQTDSSRHAILGVGQALGTPQVGPFNCGMVSDKG